MSFQPDFYTTSNGFRPALENSATPAHQQHAQPSLLYTNGQPYLHGGPSSSSYAPQQNNWQHMPTLQQQYPSQPVQPPAQSFNYAHSFSQGFSSSGTPGWAPQQAQSFARTLASGLTAPSATATPPPQQLQLHAQLAPSQPSSSHAFFQALAGSGAGQGGAMTASNHAGGRASASSGHPAQAPNAGPANPASFGFTSSYPSAQTSSTSSYGAGYGMLQPASTTNSSFAVNANESTEPRPHPSLTGMPVHILHHITVSLGPLDILHLSFTCKQLHTTWNDRFWRIWCEQEKKPCPANTPAIKHFFPDLKSQCERCGEVRGAPNVAVYTRPILHLCKPCYKQVSGELIYVNKTQATKETKIKKSVLERLPYISQGPKKMYLVRDLVIAKAVSEGTGQDGEMVTIQALGRQLLYSEPCERGAPTQKGLLTLRNDDGGDITADSVTYVPGSGPALPKPKKVKEATPTPAPRAAHARSPTTSVAGSTGRARASTASSVGAPAQQSTARTSRSPSVANSARAKEIDNIMRETRKQQLVDALDKEGFMVTEETPVMRLWISGDHLTLRTMGINSVEELVRHLLQTFWTHHRQKTDQLAAAAAAAATTAAAAGEMQANKHRLLGGGEEPDAKRPKHDAPTQPSPRLAHLETFIDHAASLHGHFDAAINGAQDPQQQITSPKKEDEHSTGEIKHDAHDAAVAGASSAGSTVKEEAKGSSATAEGDDGLLTPPRDGDGENGGDDSAT